MATDYYFLSNDQEHNIHKVVWTPTQPVKAVVQIVHGMSEYVKRYDDFAKFLNEQGFLVVGHDHLGHGLSVDLVDELGYFTEKNAAEVVVADTYAVTVQTKQAYPDVPYIILGHSMGSFVTRIFLQQHGPDVNGGIIMGTSGARPELAAALPMVKVLAKTAPKVPNEGLNSIAFGAFSKPFKEIFDHPFNWLSKSIENVEKYSKDAYLGFTFTNNGFQTLFTLMSQGTKKGWDLPIPRHLPLMIISGEEDPVGQFGKGPKKVVAELLADGFQDVTYQGYPHLRHEILNEDLQDRQLVYHDILRWLKEKTDI